MSRRFVCIHGHFYQPPRENPWLEAIEVQDSAAPFHDWNGRVTDECYAPNARARVLGPDRRIATLVNNYARMNFNFGPTVLGWLAHHAPGCYRDVLAADAEGAARFDGHGPAMAQAYNHVIMPLCNDRDRITQVRWGIRDFVHRFGRRPEGMWLPECAVDTASLEALAAEGIRFTVLAPRQAARVQPPEGDWVDVSGGRVDPRRPYRCDLPSGRSIALFFYDGPIAQSVAFEQLLDSGERFAERLVAAHDAEPAEDALVHIATDGETYGHHHRRGEMALAYALLTLDARPDIELTCYGAYLASHPPTWRVEVVEGSSWSCVHGIERWRAACGCATRSDWHQRWRAPLRQALDALRDRMIPFYEGRAGALFADPWAARDAYIDVVLDRSPERVAAFFAEHARRTLGEDEVIEALHLLELQRHAMLMYTSCGWFFDELSGLETVQVIEYAGRVVQLAARLGDAGAEALLCEGLARAPSNLPEHADGCAIYRKWVEPAAVDLRRVAAHHAIADAFTPEPDAHPIFCYDLEGFEYARHRTGDARFVVGEATVASRITRESATFRYAVLYAGGFDFTGGVLPADALDPAAIEDAVRPAFDRGEISSAIRAFAGFFEGDVFTLRALFRDEQRRVIDFVLEAQVREAEEMFAQLHGRTGPMMRFLAGLGQPPPAVFCHVAEGMINGRLRRLFEAEPLDARAVDTLVEEARAARVRLDAATLGYALTDALARRAEALRADPDDLDALRALRGVAELAWRMPFEVESHAARDVVHDVRVGAYPARRGRRDAESRAWVAEFEALAEPLGMMIADAPGPGLATEVGR